MREANKGYRKKQLEQTILDSEASLKIGLKALVALDPTLARLVANGVRPVLRKREPGFEGLASIIAGQQVSTASAAAIFSRMKEHLAPLEPGRILAATDDEFRAAGLSRPKVRTLRAVAAAISEGRISLGALGFLSAEEAHAQLVGIHGIGPWTADIYLLFCLGHPDAFPAGDLAIQEAARMSYGLDQRPDARAMTALAEQWRPWRGVAAKILWAAYRLSKGREGV